MKTTAVLATLCILAAPMSWGATVSMTRITGSWQLPALHNEIPQLGTRAAGVRSIAETLLTHGSVMAFPSEAGVALVANDARPMRVGWVSDKKGAMMSLSETIADPLQAHLEEGREAGNYAAAHEYLQTLFEGRAKSPELTVAAPAQTAKLDMISPDVKTRDWSAKLDSDLTLAFAQTLKEPSAKFHGLVRVKGGASADEVKALAALWKFDLNITAGEIATFHGASRGAVVALARLSKVVSLSGAKTVAPAASVDKQ